ncbi:MAG: hypothetical protein ABI068_04720 [Ktedonobacterales bacterium]
MSSLAAAFNRSGFSRFINSFAGRIFRLVAGAGFLILGLVGLVYQDYPLGVLSLVWSFFPLSAAVFDICYISALLGGPLSSKTIRSTRKADAR